MVFGTYLESKEVARKPGGKRLGSKYVAVKHSQTLWGLLAVSRRVYQNASDTLM